MVTVAVANDVVLEAIFYANAEDAEKGLHPNQNLRVSVQRRSPGSTNVIGHFYLSPLPGCCGIVVSHGAYLNEMSRHSGLSQAFRDIKEAVAKHFGYSLMLATNDLSNIAGTVSMSRSRYKFVKTFTNTRTGNKIGLGIKDVR